MKLLKNIVLTLIGVAALICTAVIAAGRLVLRKIREWWGRRRRCFRRSVVVMILLSLISWGAYEAYDYYEENYGRYIPGDVYLSENVEAHHFLDNTYRIYNKCTGKYTTQKVDWVDGEHSHDSLTIYSMDEKKGYINFLTGEIVVDAVENGYKECWDFSEGLAAVLKDDSIGFINTQGEVEIPFKFPKHERWDVDNRFSDGYCILVGENDFLGLIDTTGSWVLEPVYDYIYEKEENGYRIVTKDGKHGLLDSLLNVVYPTEYRDITIVDDGFVLTNDSTQWLVDLKGNVVKPFLFVWENCLQYQAGYNDCGEAEYAMSDYSKYETKGRYGILNRITGEPLTPAIFSDVEMLSKELFKVQIADGGSWYIVDKMGNMVSYEQ